MLTEYLTQIRVPKDNKQALYWHNLVDNALSLNATNLATATHSPIVIFCHNSQEGEQLKQEINYFSKKNLPIFHIPDWEILPYDQFSPHEDITSERLNALHQINFMKNGIIIIPINTAITQLMPRKFLGKYTLQLKINDNLELSAWQKQLITLGYIKTNEVYTHGEYSVRGSIIDIFPMGAKHPYRIDLFDNEIDSIRSFDPENQRSCGSLNVINLLPTSECMLTDETITQFRQSWRKTFSGNPNACSIYQAVSKGNTVSGIEFYLPFFYEQTNTIFDYLPKESIIIYNPGTQQNINQAWEQINTRYEQLAHDITQPILNPKALYINIDTFNQKLKTFKRIILFKKREKNNGAGVSFDTKLMSDLSINHRLANPAAQVESFIESFQGKVLIAVQHQGRIDAICKLLEHSKNKLKEINHYNDIKQFEHKAFITIAPMINGFIDDIHNIALIGEGDLFHETQSARKHKKTTQDPNSIIKNLSELSMNDPVVHTTHGIGYYKGLKHITTNHITQEYLIIEYANDDKIFVPIDRLSMINKYIGSDKEKVQPNKLGSKQWSIKKEKALKKIKDIAAELLILYSKRQSSKGFCFAKPNHEFEKFKLGFAFTETPDQSQAIQSVINDMTQDKPMDRLICGDVGFGKTEVAMQAAALALQSEKQVAVLAPTTLLVNQHIESFVDRFSTWPVTIKGLSRFNSAKNKLSILKELKLGKVDITIGTHQLLSSDIQFKNLGLLIVDEEHRFGVNQKEKIKKIKENIDILTLTATPIPRTFCSSF